MEGGRVSWPGVARVVLRFSRTYGDDMLNIVHVRRDDETDPTPAWMNLVAEVFRDGWWDIAAVTTDIRAITTNDVTLADITVISQDPSTGPIFHVETVNQAGSGTGSVGSPQLAAVVSHRTDVASRSGRGRTYHGGLDQSLLSASTSAPSVWGATVITALQGAWGGLDAALALLTPATSHVIASVVDATARDVTNRLFRTTPYTQRRRVT
jgi:hypothetical protein